jgi:hypothetical protein
LFRRRSERWNFALAVLIVLALVVHLGKLARVLVNLSGALFLFRA